MLFRWAIGFGYLLFVVNPDLVLHLGRINPIQKAAILVAALLYVFTRPVDKRVWFDGCLSLPGIRPRRTDILS